jgi:hypothetical protein
MDRDEAIGLQKTEKFIKKVVRVFLNEVQQVLDIIVVEGLKAALQAPGRVYDISSFSPELENSVKCAFRKATAIQDVIKM